MGKMRYTMTRSFYVLQILSAYTYMCVYVCICTRAYTHSKGNNGLEGN